MIFFDQGYLSARLGSVQPATGDQEIWASILKPAFLSISNGDFLKGYHKASPHLILFTHFYYLGDEKLAGFDKHVGFTSGDNELSTFILGIQKFGDAIEKADGLLLVIWRR